MRKRLLVIAAITSLASLSTAASTQKGPLHHRSFRDTSSRSDPQQKRSVLYGAVVSIGDSYSDNGHPRSARLTKEMPLPPNWEGRYSNGPVFPEWLAEQVTVKNKLYSYAYGHAQVDNVQTHKHNIIPDCKSQTSTHLSDLQSYQVDLSGRTLYVYLGGINSISAIWSRLLRDDPSAAYIPSWSIAVARLTARDIFDHLQSIEDLRTSNGSLTGQGWDYVVLTIPPLQLLPGRILMTTHQDLQARRRQLLSLQRLTEAFNEELLNGAERFASLTAKSGAKVKVFDLRKRWYEYHDDPESFGLDASELGQPCYRRNAGQVCSDPQQRIQWDMVHPVSSVHRDIAESIASIL